jgi:hypothetical protein
VCGVFGVWWTPQEALLSAHKSSEAGQGQGEAGQRDTGVIGPWSSDLPAGPSLDALGSESTHGGVGVGVGVGCWVWAGCGLGVGWMWDAGCGLGVGWV